MTFLVGLLIYPVGVCKSVDQLFCCIYNAGDDLDRKQQLMSVVLFHMYCAWLLRKLGQRKVKVNLDESSFTFFVNVLFLKN